MNSSFAINIRGTMFELALLILDETFLSINQVLII